MDLDGKTTLLRATPAIWNSPQFSPDGSLLALDITDERGQDDIWLYDWTRDQLTRRTFDASNERGAVWTPDGRRLTFTSARPNDFGLYWRRADGIGDTQRLTRSKNLHTAGSWHPSGKLLMFEETTVKTRVDLMLLPMEGDEVSGWKPGTPTPFLNSPETETQPAFSPDGRWIAYAATDSGENEVYVRSFPGPVGQWQVSTGGGSEAQWSRTRKELFYRSGRDLMVVSFAIEDDSFRVEKTRQVGSSERCRGNRCTACTPMASG